jgi:hypothetical protein
MSWVLDHWLERQKTRVIAPGCLLNPVHQFNTASTHTVPFLIVLGAEAGEKKQKARR